MASGTAAAARPPAAGRGSTSLSTSARVSESDEAGANKPGPTGRMTPQGQRRRRLQVVSPRAESPLGHDSLHQ